MRWKNIQASLGEICAKFYYNYIYIYFFLLWFTEPNCKDQTSQRVYREGVFFARRANKGISQREQELKEGPWKQAIFFGTLIKLLFYGKAKGYSCDDKHSHKKKVLPCQSIWFIAQTV